MAPASTSPTAAIKRRRSSKAQQPPALNTWVTLAPDQRGKRAQMAAATSALVSAVQLDEATATVIYPNELVLVHGFKGDPLKRITAVPFSRLRPAVGTQALLDLLMTAVRATASASFTRCAQESQQPVDDVVVDNTVVGSELNLISCQTSVVEASNWDPSPLMADSHVSAVETPRTPCQEPATRQRSRSRSQQRKKRGERRFSRIEKSQAMALGRAVASAAARAFRGVSQLPLVELLRAIDADAGLEELRKQPTWSAQSAVKSLEASQKVFIADELVFLL